MDKFLIFAVLLAGPFSVANADVYKCTGTDGRVSFASIPCMPDKGLSTWETATKRTVLTSVSAEDAKPENINQRATDILRSGYHTHYHYKVVYVPALPAANHR